MIPMMTNDRGNSQSIRETVSAFAQAEIAPRAHAIDTSNTFPHDLWPKWAASAFSALPLKKPMADLGFGYLAHVIAMEEISRASAAIGLSYGAHSNLCINQISRNGTAAQKERYLPDLSAVKKSARSP